MSESGLRLALFMPTMKVISSWTILLSFVGPVIGQATLFNPVREYSGSTFFDRWSYFGAIDNLTWGNVTWVDQATATTDQLTFVNDAGNAVIKVDNFTNVTPAPLIFRNAVRLTSTDLYGIGSLVMIDAVHLPYGCSVWPAFWTVGPETKWPGSGEIDIIEGINQMPNNQIAVHTPPGCTHSNTAAQSGTSGNFDCSSTAGCVVGVNQPNSYGKGFADAGGGVYALLIDVPGISVWFFSRPDIPEVIQQANTSSQMDISTWGIPTASYPNTTCNIRTHFPPQQLEILTTLCGLWAAQPDIYRSTCQTRTGSCLNDNIIGNGSNYFDAYWEIQYIRTYLSVDQASPTPLFSVFGAHSTTKSSKPSGTSSPRPRPTSSAKLLQRSIFSWVFPLLLISMIGVGVY